MAGTIYKATIAHIFTPTTGGYWGVTLTTNSVIESVTNYYVLGDGGDITTEPVIIEPPVSNGFVSVESLDHCTRSQLESR